MPIYIYIIASLDSKCVENMTSSAKLVCITITTIVIMTLFLLLLPTDKGYRMMSDCIAYIYHERNETQHFNESVNTTNDVIDMKQVVVNITQL